VRDSHNSIDFLYLPGKWAFWTAVACRRFSCILHSDQFSNLEISEHDSRSLQRKRLHYVRLLPSEFSKDVSMRHLHKKWGRVSGYG
jgi:hypothetical protein